MLSVVLLSVVMLSVVLLSVVLFSVVLLCVVLRSVVLLGVVPLSVVLLCKHCAKWHALYECHVRRWAWRHSVVLEMVKCSLIWFRCLCARHKCLTSMAGRGKKNAISSDKLRELLNITTKLKNGSRRYPSLGQFFLWPLDLLSRLLPVHATIVSINRIDHQLLCYIF